MPAGTAGNIIPNDDTCIIQRTVKKVKLPHFLSVTVL